MKLCRTYLKKSSLLLSGILILLLTSCGAKPADIPAALSNQAEALPASDALQEENITELNVAIFPYVPQPLRFTGIIEEEWKKLHPDVALNFIEWDCYESESIPDNLDVFTFDAIYLTEYASKGQLLSLSNSEIKEKEDILPFVNSELQYSGANYGIPQMICANLFFYRQNDTALASVNDVSTLYDKLKASTSTAEKPAANEGLLVDMSSGTGNICFYLDAIIDTKAVYTDFTQMPDLNKLNEKALEGLNQMVLMAGSRQAYVSTEDPYERATWFAEGSGRAYIGYSESMSGMGDSVNNIKIKTMSLADRDDIPLFYADVVSINSRLSNNAPKKALAIELVNLMTSSTTVTAIISAPNASSYPQYILPARTSCFQDLKTKYPVYNQLHQVASQKTNHVFRMGSNAHSFISEAKVIVKNYLLN